MLVAFTVSSLMAASMPRLPASAASSVHIVSLTQ
jgi:hypothetical protein